MSPNVSQTHTTWPPPLHRRRCIQDQPMEHWWRALMLQHGELTTIISLGQTNIDVEKTTPFVDHLPRKTTVFRIYVIYVIVHLGYHYCVSGSLLYHDDCIIDYI